MNYHRLSFLASSLAAVVFASAPLAMVACGQDTGSPASPAPVAPATLPENAPLATPVTAKRTVEVRNPFGNTLVSNNLMADGDFELTGRYDQQSWRAFDTSGQAVLNFDTGGHCRSGVRCLSLVPSDIIIGWFAAPPEQAVSVSLWAKPSKGTSCKDLIVHVLDFDNEDDTSKEIAAPKIDDTGMCHFEGLTSKMPAGGQPAVWLEIAKNSTVSFIVDDVVATPAPAPVKNLHAFAATAAAPARFHAVADWVHRHRRFGLPPATGPEHPALPLRQRLRER